MKILYCGKYLINKKVRLGIIDSCRNLSLCLQRSQQIKGPTELSTAYVPKEIDNIPLKDEYFKPPLKGEDKFTMILPPPNITGTLHLGHALTTTIQDVLIKWHRMRGIDTVWVPGMDHAGIATQVVVEKKLWKEKKKTRHDIGREKFEEEVWKWKKEKSDAIGEQLRRLGASLDWDREIFTMNPAQSRAVIEAFVKLYDQNLLYEADYLVNWSCILRSAISDIEVDHLSITGPTDIPVPGYEKPIRFGLLTNFAYKLQDSDDEVVVATTRPETMLGDVAVAVNPKDNRYSRFIGKQLWHPFRAESIPVISDEFVDPEFGTGAVKITPAHDHTDFEVGQRHKLKSLSIIDETGRITSDPFKGLQRFEARDAIINALQQQNLFRSQQDHAMIIPICNRSKDIVEFLIKPQWFLKSDEMAKKAANAVREGNLKIDPGNFEKIWFEWLDNIRDWCVSRQLWWGHRIPIYCCWIKDKPDHVRKIAAHNMDDAIVRAKTAFGDGELIVQQIDDVLDTWFSSALLPMSSFGWPKQSENYSSNFPLSVMETGHDILFFWVARMVMLGTHLTGKLPFDRILLHGIICDSGGRKMSKSLGNVVSPEDVIEGRTLEELEQDARARILDEEELTKAVQGQRRMFPEGIPECGVDALRFTLCTYNVKGHYISFDVQECRTNKFFGNKLWQATKFAVKWCRSVTEVQELKDADINHMGEMDRWILSRLSYMVAEVDRALKGCEFHVATTAIKNFLYYEFCDVYIETTKVGFKSPESETAAEHCWTLIQCLDVGLRCLAPFMPHLYQHLHQQLLIHPVIANSNKYFLETLPYRDEILEKEVESMMNIVKGIRRLKKIFNVSSKHNPTVVLITSGCKHVDRMASLSGCNSISLRKDGHGLEAEYVSDVIADGTIIHLCVPDELRKAYDVDAGKLDKKREKLVRDLEKLKRGMETEGYKAKVSVEMHRANLRKVALFEEKIQRIDYMQSFAQQFRNVNC